MKPVKPVKLPEFKKYRKLKNILLETIQYQDGKILLWRGIWNEEHVQLYYRLISLSEQLISVIEKIVTTETKMQLPSVIDDSIEFIL